MTAPLLIAACAVFGSVLGVFGSMASGASGAKAAAGPAEGAIELVPVATGLQSPLFVTHAGDGSGQLFVVEQGGTVRVIDGVELSDDPILRFRPLAYSASVEKRA